jgi:hypothetical protein
MPTTLTIPEVLKKISQNAKSREDIVRMLRENSSHALKQLLRYAFFENTKWYRSDLPPFTPDAAPEGLTMTSLFQESKRLYIFKETYNLSKERKDILLIQILEGIHPDETNVIRELFAGTFGYGYGLSKPLVQEAFPDIATTVLAS